VLRERIVDEVYFAVSSHRMHAGVQQGVAICERLGVPFAIPICDYRLARARPAYGGSLSDGYVHYLMGRYSPVQAAVKRMLDILASSAALVVLSPLLLCAALAVKLSSRGPVFFRQERVGLHGRTFAMLKFRSMVSNAEALKADLEHRNEQAGPVFKIAHDPRVTAVGRFLRKHSIDELPQLVNVLRGDMSLVGPRPPLPKEVAKYEAWQRRRLSVRPGLTCVWQVSGRNQISFEQWMLLDMQYIDHWNLLQDLRLIVRTVPVVLSGRGAS
jgi:exopolysaccharide biosynthesis polyprenyl glycosylphosphotransferase